LEEAIKTQKSLGGPGKWQDSKNNAIRRRKT